MVPPPPRCVADLLQCCAPLASETQEQEKIMRINLNKLLIMSRKCKVSRVDKQTPARVCDGDGYVDTN
jgi:hypothetical protein